MKFRTTTSSPVNRPVEKPVNNQTHKDEIKSLLFQALALYVEDNPEAKQELLDMLTTDKGMEKAS